MFRVVQHSGSPLLTGREGVRFGGLSGYSARMFRARGYIECRSSMLRI